MQIDNKKDPKKVKKTTSVNSVIELHPVIKDVNEHGPAVAKSALAERVLRLSNRHKEKIAENNLPENRVLKGPRSNAGSQDFVIESAEYRKLIDALLTEQVDAKIDKLLRIGLGDKNKLNQYRQALSNPEQASNTIVLRKYIIDVLNKLMKLVTDDGVVYQRLVAALIKRRDSNIKESEVAIALQKKTDKTGIPFETLAEVYYRGVMTWDDSCKVDAKQFAFNRVNSFISGGRAARLDEDLVVRDKAFTRRRDVTGKIVVDREGHAKTVKRTTGEIKINELAVELNPKLKNKTKNREVYGIQVRGKDPLSSDVNEKFETSEKQSKDPKDAASRFDSTDSVVSIYKNDTPGENKKTLKQIKKVVEAKIANVPVRMINGKMKSLPPGKSSSSKGGDGE